MGVIARVERRGRSVQAQELHQHRPSHAGAQSRLLGLAQADDLELRRVAVHERRGDLQRDPLGGPVGRDDRQPALGSTRRRSRPCRGEGYDYNRAASYSINYFPLNLNNPKIGPVFKQLYFRQAFQHLIDQPGWINAFLHNTAIPTYGPIPSSPPSPLVSFDSSMQPVPVLDRCRAALLSSHGWKVVPSGSSTCQHPGHRGEPVRRGHHRRARRITFNLDYQAGTSTIQSEMNDLAAQAKKVGINLQLTAHPFDTVISTAVACQPTAPDCGWTAENWGAGWIFAPDFLPTGESLYGPGAVANYGSFNDPHATSLITATITGAAANEKQALANYAQYMEQNVPVVYGPTSIGSYQGDAGTMIDKKLGGYAANAYGYLVPETCYFTK